MPIWEAVLLGVVQGLTEFLPVSSTAHLLVTEQLLGWSAERMRDDPFTVVVQLGTLVAVLAYFRADLGRIGRGVLADLRAGRVGATADGRLGWLIVLGTVPAAAVGFLFKRQLKERFFNVESVAVVATVFALLLAAAEWYARRRERARPARGEAELGWVDAVWVGVWQAFALMPGGSRSGTTLTGGLFAGLARPAAARFSFLLSVPIILGAGLKDLYDEYKKYRHPDGPGGLFASGDEVTALAVGTLTAAVVGYLAIAWLLHFLKRYSTAVFIVYRLLLGAVILAAVRTGFLG